jgi:hypothetical protein
MKYEKILQPSISKSEKCEYGVHLYSGYIVQIRYD